MSDETIDPITAIMLHIMKQQPMEAHDVFMCLRRHISRAQETFKSELEDSGNGIPSDIEVACVGGVMAIECFAVFKIAVTLAKEGLDFSKIINMSGGEVVDAYNKFANEECEICRG